MNLSNYTSANVRLAFDTIWFSRKRLAKCSLLLTTGMLIVNGQKMSERHDYPSILTLMYPGLHYWCPSWSTSFYDSGISNGVFRMGFIRKDSSRRISRSPTFRNVWSESATQQNWGRQDDHRINTTYQLLIKSEAAELIDGKALPSCNRPGSSPRSGPMLRYCIFVGFI